MKQNNKTGWKITKNCINLLYSKVHTKLILKIIFEDEKGLIHNMRNFKKYKETVIYKIKLNDGEK